MRGHRGLGVLVAKYESETMKFFVITDSSP